jgi:hypothetical protein
MISSNKNSELRGKKNEETPEARSRLSADRERYAERKRKKTQVENIQSG